MKILLDECVDRRFAREFPAHEVKTVPQMGWATIKNGELMKLAEKSFDVFITVDRNLSYQQNLPRYALAVIVIGSVSNRFDDLKAVAPIVETALARAKPGEALVIGRS